MLKRFGVIIFLFFVFFSQAQETFPVNGVADDRTNTFAFVHATIVNPQATITNGTLVISMGKIVNAGNNVQIPSNAIIVDCGQKYIYPSFIDIFSNYGLPPVVQPEKAARGNYQNVSNTKGAFSWNQALKPETDASAIFSMNEANAKELRDIGFGTVLSHQHDGISRGSGTLVTLGNDNDNLQMLKEKAAAFYSFNKGISSQDYPTSLMGAIALLRQTYLDAQWYKSRPAKEGVNLSLEAWNNLQTLPQIFDSNDKWNDLRANKIGKEYGSQYILKAGLNEYQRIAEMKATGASFILPVNFPAPMDLEDASDARLVALSVLKHWEMAPLQPGLFEKATINFCLTTNGLKSMAEFIPNLRKAITNGLSETKALEALTKTPASLLGVYEKVGSLEPGKVANFIITSGPVFDEKTVVFQNWVQGKKFSVNEKGWNDLRGNYTLIQKLNQQNKEFTIEIKGTLAKPVASIQVAGDTTKSDVQLSVNENVVKLIYSLKTDSSNSTVLNGIVRNAYWTGTGYSTSGAILNWNMQRTSPFVAKPDTLKKDSTTDRVASTVVYPFNGYGFAVMPTPHNTLFKNATVWTNEQDGKLPNTDVLVSNGKIVAVGKNLAASGATVIDATGKHLTPGIIDEHSHIAISGGVNECSQSVTSEVRVADVIDPEDINIYRQLAGGVTSSHLLHGSCNTIGGQTELIKLRWGKNAEELKFGGADHFIKFALGENVKRSYSSLSNRFPDTRMGVEQVLVDAFERAQDYERMGNNKRKDLELEALSNILHHKLFITSHSYVQSEINMLLHVADRFGFTVNTFTHILEGYKVADKLKAHGSAASTFSDWWAYKAEVQDAIAYNAAIMQKVGVLVAINSDDPEMARHLNQEAAKTIKYGNVAELDAFKMCTLNPATMLHVANQTGSIKVGKDADLVLWSDSPVSNYAKAEKTMVDGIIYFDLERDSLLRKSLETEKVRLIQKIVKAKKSGTKTVPAVITLETINECEEDNHKKRGVLDLGL